MIPTMENLEITKRFYDELTAIQVRKTAWRKNLQDLKKLKLTLETSSIFIEAFCVLSIMPDRPVRDQWDYPRKNGVHQFSDQAGPTESNGYHPFLFLSRISYISEIYWREVEERTGSLSKRNGTESRCNRSDRFRLQSEPLPEGSTSIVSPDVLFARSRFARTECWFARSMKSFRPSLFLLDLRIKRIKSSSGFFSNRSNDKSNTNKQVKKVREYSSF